MPAGSNDAELLFNGKWSADALRLINPGGWYIGGDFTVVGGQARNHLARINSDGTLNAWSPNADSSVSSMTLDGTSAVWRRPPTASC